MMMMPAVSGVFLSARMAAASSKRTLLPRRLAVAAASGPQQERATAATGARINHRSSSSSSSSVATYHHSRHRHAASAGATTNTKLFQRGPVCRRSTTTIRSFSAANDDEEQQRQVSLEHLSVTPDDENDDHDDDPRGCPRISLLTLNRPKANAMGSLFLGQLQDCLTGLEDQQQQEQQSKTTRCLVVSSALPKVFSAGADLKERATMSLEESEAFVCELRTTFQRLAQLPIPSVAAVRGVALGGGLELALACDILVASKCATLGLPEVSLAIVPGAGGTQRLSRRIGAGNAKRLVLTGDRISGEEAHRLGLVQELVDDPTQVLDEAIALARRIASNGPVAVAAAKWAIDEGSHAPTMADALEIERRAYGRVLATKDRLEGLAAFKEGRKPNYRGE